MDNHHIISPDRDAELYVLKAVMEDNKRILDLNPDMFSEPIQQEIFKAMQHINKEGGLAVFTTLSHYFSTNTVRKSKKENYEPSEFIAHLMEINSLNAGEADNTYQENIFTISDIAKRNKIASLANELLMAACDRQETLDPFLEKFNSEKNEVINRSYNKYDKLVEIQSPEEIRASLAETTIGTPTNYGFVRNNGELEQLILPSSSITFICGQTSHGKSRFLQNLALNVAQNKEDGLVLYFTFEEDKKAVYKELLNIYADMDIAANNIRSIGSYFRGKYYFKEGVSIAEFQAKERKFMEEIIQSGKLFIVEEDYDSTELILAIRTIARNKKIKAIFVDYAQLLNKAGNKASRPEELKEIGKDFLKLTKEISVPVIMAAQLNREAKSPMEMHNQNISEASDLEKVANTIIMLWNSSFRPLNGSDYKNGIPELAERGYNIGVAGKIYALLTKYRGGERGLDAILDFNGNTGSIRYNYDSTNDEKVKKTVQPGIF